jgi:PBP superfamily domain
MKNIVFYSLNVLVRTFFCASFLAGCMPSSGPQSMQAPTTLYPLRVNITPSIRNYRQVLNQCAQSQPDIALFVTETSAANLEKKESDLQLRLGLPSQGVDYAFQMGTEKLQFVINSNQKAPAITTSQIPALFDGEITDWGQASGSKGAVHPWVYPDDNELELIFKRYVMNGEHVSPTASIAADPESMQQAIAQDAYAIGFLPSSWLTHTIQTIELSNQLAAQLSIPVIAMTESKPQGPLGIFIACLQQNGNKMIESH